MPLSTQASRGDVTQFDHATLSLDLVTPLGPREQQLELEGQFDKNIHGITVSAAMRDFMVRDDTVGVAGTLTVSLGQPEPIAQPNQFRERTRMPVRHRYQLFHEGGFPDETGEDTIPKQGWFHSGIHPTRYLNDPQTQFIWRAGETVFIHVDGMVNVGHADPLRWDIVFEYEEI